MKLLKAFVAQYPSQSIVLVMVLLLAGVADGIGFSAMLPLLNLALDSNEASRAAPDGLEAIVQQGLARLGLTPSVGLLLIVIVAGIAAKNLLIFVAEQRIGYIAADVTTKLRMRLLRAVTSSRWEYYVDQSAGRLANSLATEAMRASTAYIYGVRFLALAVEVLVYATLALVVSWIATLICLAAAAVIFTASDQFVRISRRAGARQTSLYQSLLSSLTDILQSVKTFKAMGRIDAAQEVLVDDTDDLRHTLKREVLGKAALQSVPEPMYTAVLAAGLYVAFVQFSFEIATVLFLVLLLSRLMRRMGKLQRNFQHMVTCETAYWAIIAAIEQAQEQREPNPGTLTPSIERGIFLDAVRLAYGDIVVLDEVTMVLPVRQLTCLVGESGSGKTSIADLVLGLIVPDAGSVRLDDRPLLEHDLGLWRSSIGYVAQENLLLNDTVFHNVTLGSAGATQADVELALDAAGALDFVRELDDGVYTIVGERGNRISGGQRQRIMIARAIVHRPSVLILDEATSSLDAVTETAIFETLSELKRHMTIFAISHKTTVIQYADRVYSLAEGQVRLWEEGREQPTRHF